MTWDGLGQAFLHGHTRPKASIEDSFLYRGDDTVLSRAAWIDGMGQLVKTATIFPGNAAQGLSSINGAVTLFSDETGVLEAVIDFHLVTKWKTAGDSVFAATQLARPDSRNILIVGAGTVAHSLREAYGALFPDAQFTVWNRSPAGAEALAAAYPNVTVASDLEAAVRAADIVTCATMSTQPILHGDWLQPGQHIDLIGAYRPDMREADDACLQRARIFVDSRDTTLGHIGEIKIPLEANTISEVDILADYYQPEQFKRLNTDEITLFKNGGGAHLDLMTSRYILEAWRAR
ncbi:ornithine cyclodeaminase family protein [Cognatishimia sp. MH4019]|uniref:ornithine cyclodeaminase family protein n=1 Tax=Cognatishimia sp. MH4019 TaxID=2854030 RepID=UPI0021064988|nr:ornithine cyclodeaminase [Cognatishimia sp. MH4019]